MYEVILIVCTIAAVAIYFGILRPVAKAVVKFKAESKRQAMIERGTIAVEKIKAAREARELDDCIQYEVTE
jgi:hypothetical protein